MEKREMNSEVLDNSRLLFQGDNSFIYQLSDGSVLKLFNIKNLRYFWGNEISSFLVKKEIKIEMADCFKGFEELVLPKTAYYSDGKIIGYTTDKIEGEDFNNSFKIQGLVDLKLLSERFKLLEDVYKKGHDLGIVFPDSLSTGNLRFDSTTNKIRVMDYDGLQIKGIYTNEICTDFHIRQNSVFITPKYFEKDHFKKSIDQCSLGANYVYYATNLNLFEQPFLKDRSYVYNVCSFLGINDKAMVEKLMMIYDKKMDNEYFGDDFLRLGREYDLVPNYFSKDFNMFKKRKQ